MCLTAMPSGAGAALVATSHAFVASDLGLETPPNLLQELRLSLWKALSQHFRLLFPLKSTVFGDELQQGLLQGLQASATAPRTDAPGDLHHIGQENTERHSHAPHLSKTLEVTRNVQRKR